MTTTSGPLTDPGHLAFWARPAEERAAAFAALRRLDAPRWFPFRNRMPFTPTEDGFLAVVRHAHVVAAGRGPGLLGNEPIPERHRATVARHGDTLVGFTDPECTGIPRAYLLRHGAPGPQHVLPGSLRIARAGHALVTLVDRLGRERLREPRDDLVTTRSAPGRRCCCSTARSTATRT